MTSSVLRLGLRLAGILVLLPLAIFWSGLALGAGPYAMLSLFASQFAYVLLVALAASVSALGVRRLALGLRFALLDEHPATVGEPRPELIAAAESLALVGRVAVGLGLIWSFAEALSMLGMIEAASAGRPLPEPRGFARGISGVLVVPLMAILTGRLLLAGWANSAFRAGGDPERRAFARASDLSLIAYLVPILFFVSLTFWKFQVR